MMSFFDCHARNVMDMKRNESDRLTSEMSCKVSRDRN